MALIDLTSAIIGFVVGGAIVAFVVETMGRAKTVVPPAAKLTSAWRISELGRDAMVVARDITEVDVPAGARILASGIVDPAVFNVCEVREVPEVKAEYAVDAAGTRAMMFLAGARRGTLALVSTDEQTVSRLQAEALSLWTQADPYVERHSIAGLAGRNGLNVETTGTVQEVLPYMDKHLIRLADGPEIIGVIVEKDPKELLGKDILVKGRLEKDRSGFPVIAATDLRRMN